MSLHSERPDVRQPGTRHSVGLPEPAWHVPLSRLCELTAFFHPASEPPGQRPPARGAAEQDDAPSARRRVLVIEDNRDTANVLAELLGMAGYHAATARSGHEGLIVAQAFAPDIVVLDIGLPDLNGYQVAHRLRADARPRRVGIVAYTGRMRDLEAELAHAARFDRYIMKPAPIEEILAALAACV